MLVDALPIHICLFTILICLFVIPEEDGDHSPAVQALARANSINLAKSMVNIYTTTESE